jgi:hypothetical protein
MASAGKAAAGFVAVAVAFGALPLVLLAAPVARAATVVSGPISADTAWGGGQSVPRRLAPLGMGEASVGDVLAGIPFQAVEGFESSDPYNLPRPGPADVLRPGSAYWVLVSQDASVSFTN